MIRKDISRSHKVAQLSPKSLALFGMLLPHYNVHGKMDANPHTIKGTIVPFIDWFDIPTITLCLREISDKTNVKYFQVDGCWYLHSLNYDEHQDLRRKGRDYLPSYTGEVQEKSGITPGEIPPEVEVEPELEPEPEPEPEPEVEVEKTKARRARKPSPSFVLPASIRPEVWEAFEDHRKKKRSPMTDRARELTVRECERLGGDPNELIEYAILRGWKTVFPMDNGSGRKQGKSEPKGAAAVRSWAEKNGVTA